jgi:preprotein translocase subunit SecE
MPNKITNYIKESKDELKKVVWPSRKETIKLTLLVIGISLFVAVFLGAVDFILTLSLDKIITK